VAVNTLYLNAGVLLCGLAITAPDIMGIMARETIFIISRRFMPNLTVEEVESWTSLVRDPCLKTNMCDVTHRRFNASRSN
jgi:hypothetical protein